ncbi:FAR1 domain-containing protein, partial [Cephalotus follicularis]
ISESIFGKSFATSNDAYTFYNNYALSKGFGIRKQTHTKSRSMGDLIRIVYVCNQDGEKSLRDGEVQETRRRRDTRTGCMAKLEVALANNEMWIVDKFNDVHNHFIIPRKVMKHRSHKK